jgi:hypothetical protein
VAALSEQLVGSARRGILLSLGRNLLSQFRPHECGHYKRQSCLLSREIRFRGLDRMNAVTTNDKPRQMAPLSAVSAADLP